MARNSGTDPAAVDAAAATAALEDGDGSEMIGTLVDNRYKLEATLGRGGMGLVYRAAHVGLRRQVAVKILHPSLAASSDVRNRFEREALAVGKIDHPNCVSVYDVGRLPDNSLYLAMELLDGKSLADVLEAEGQLAPGRALHILAGILRGLAHIHNAGLIHRDIKPENIFLIRHGADEDFAKILDFGIAKPMAKTDLDDGVKLTQAGMAFGTPIYMAPEQALGAPMDGRADLYAAAVLGYEMLCGQPPFYSEDKLEVMSMHTAKPVPPMRQRLLKGARPVPSSIERLIAKGLTKKPSDRWSSAELFLAAVEESLATPDGGVTEVNFQRVDDTGSQPLVTEDGQVDLARAEIAHAIDDVLATPAKAVPVVTSPRAATPPRGLGPGLGLGPAADRATSPAMGGVGLGLPYTGPSGEPIFGLTPEQRLAGAGFPPSASASFAGTLEPELATTPVIKARRPWPIYAAILGLAIVAGVVIAVVTAGGGGDDAAAVSPAAAEAREALFDRKDPVRALEILEEHRAEVENDAVAAYVRGHAYAMRNDGEASANAYARALALDPELERDPVLRQDLRGFANSNNPLMVQVGFDVWIRTKDPAAHAGLIAAAIDEDITRRQMVREVIEKHKVDGVDLLVSYALDLQQEPSCELRREAVAKLRALANPAAIPVLEGAIVRRGKSPPYAGKPINRCLIDDARAAIEYLKAQPKPR